MTRQIEGAYRRNKRKSWLLIAAVAALVAVVAIPIASGGPGKTYAFAPATVPDFCTGAAAGQVTFTIQNTDKSARLGSANITIPPSVITASAPAVGVTPGSGDNPSATVEENIIKLRGLTLVPKQGNTQGGKATVTFTATPATSPGSGAINAQVKQANDFSDSGSNPSANGFDNPALPTLTVKDCTAKISGTIFQDLDQNGLQSGTLESGITAFKVYVYKRTGTDTYALVNSGGTATDTAGYYEVNATINNTYLVCEGVASSSWAQTSAPPPASDSAPCATNGNERSGYLIDLTTDAPNKDFGNVPAVPASCNTILSGTVVGSSGTFEYEARLSGSQTACKTGDLIMYTYQQGSTRVATLSPPGSNGGATFPVVERIKWTSVGANQNPITVKYDDVYPYNGKDANGNDDLKTMLMCNADPRDPNATGPDAAFILKPPPRPQTPTPGCLAEKPPA